MEVDVMAEDFDAWFKRFNTRGMSHADLLQATLSTPGDSPGDVVHEGARSSMTRHQCSLWIDFYGAAQCGWNARGESEKRSRADALRAAAEALLDHRDELETGHPLRSGLERASSMVRALAAREGAP